MVTLANLTRAVPTVALLTILPLTFIGFGYPPIVAALALFALPPLLANAYLGVREVDADIKEAARGMGLSGPQSVYRVELPLAVPSIIAGLRIATVTVISLATVAAFVDNEGLGVPIFAGIQQSVFKTEIYAAGFLAIALAISADVLLLGAQRAATPWARRRAGT